MRKLISGKLLIVMYALLTIGGLWLAVYWDDVRNSKSQAAPEVSTTTITEASNIVQETV